MNSIINAKNVSSYKVVTNKTFSIEILHEVSESYACISSSITVVFEEKFIVTYPNVKEFWQWMTQCHGAGKIVVFRTTVTRNEENLLEVVKRTVFHKDEAVTSRKFIVVSDYIKEYVDAKLAKATDQVRFSDL